jgi:hypothetical protein
MKIKINKITLASMIYIIFFSSLIIAEVSFSPQKPNNHFPQEIDGFFNLSANIGVFLKQNAQAHLIENVEVGNRITGDIVNYDVDVSVILLENNKKNINIKCCKSTEPLNCDTLLTEDDRLFSSLNCTKHIGKPLTIDLYLRSTGIVLIVKRDLIFAEKLTDKALSRVCYWGEECA